MRRISLKRIWGLLLAAGILALAPTLLASAASGPGFVKQVKATDVRGTKATLSWSRAKNATGYNIYRVDPETGDLIGTKPVKTTTGLSCTVSLKLGTTYSFQVFAYKKNGKKTVENEEGSPPIDVEPQLLHVLSYGNQCVYLEWDKVKNADGYILYRRKPGGEFKEIKTLKSGTTGCKVKVPANTTYRFKLCSYKMKNGEKVLSEPSNIVKFKGKKLESVHGRRWQVTLKKTIKATNSETGEKVTLKAGTRLTASSFSTGMINVTTAKGDTYKIKGSNCTFGDYQLAPSYDYYTRLQAEEFVNKKKYSSKTNYLIWISQYTASVHFFKGSQGKWKEQRVAQCIIGGENGRTRLGEFETFLHDNTVHFYWSTIKNWGQAFHGWIDAHRWGTYSKGCVRLPPDDLKYLRSLPLGTKVVSY